MEGLELRLLITNYQAFLGRSVLNIFRKEQTVLGQTCRLAQIGDICAKCSRTVVAYLCPLISKRKACTLRHAADHKTRRRTQGGLSRERARRACSTCTVLVWQNVHRVQSGNMPETTRTIIAVPRNHLHYALRDKNSSVVPYQLGDGCIMALMKRWRY